jgi:hypothetical protein
MGICCDFRLMQTGPFDFCVITPGMRLTDTDQTALRAIAEEYFDPAVEVTFSSEYPQSCHATSRPLP